MVDEVLRGFWTGVRLVPGDRRHRAQPAERLKGPFMAFGAIEHRYAQVVIYQDEAKRVSSQPRFAYVEELNRKQRKMWVDVLVRASKRGYFRPDLDVDLVYRFIRDTTRVSVRWYQPGGPMTAEQVGQQPAIVLGGIPAATPEGEDMPEAYIIDAVRPRSEAPRLAGPGALIDLGVAAFVVSSAVLTSTWCRRRRGRRCVDAIGGGGAATSAATRGGRPGYPEEVPGVTVDRQCGLPQRQYRRHRTRRIAPRASIRVGPAAVTRVGHSVSSFSFFFPLMKSGFHSSSILFTWCSLLTPPTRNAPSRSAPTCTPRVRRADAQGPGHRHPSAGCCHRPPPLAGHQDRRSA